MNQCKALDVEKTPCVFGNPNPAVLHLHSPNPIPVQYLNSRKIKCLILEYRQGISIDLVTFSNNNKQCRCKYDKVDLPDNANVWRPPAATAMILTPGFSVTRHGNAERFSSPEEELSAACLADDTRLLFVVSSPPLPSVLDEAPPLDLGPWERGLTVI